MKISTRQDLVAAAKSIADGTLEPKDIEFSEYITDTIKIVSEGWDDAKNIDYKSSELILAVQKDVIGVYNFIYNKDISIKELDDYKFLVVKFSIEDGCIKFISRITRDIILPILDDIKSITGIFEGMSPNKKIAFALILLAVVGTLKAPDIIRAIRENPVMFNDFISNESIAEALAKNQKTQAVIINNIGDGHVIYNGVEFTKEDYENSLIKNEAPDIAPVLVDDEFLILKYDFKGQKAYLAWRGMEFWASTEWLRQEGRERLTESTSAAIAQQTVAKERITMSCKIYNGKIGQALIEGIGLPARQGTIDLAVALNRTKKAKNDKHEQASLLDD